VATPQPEIGPLLREWRERRRLTQLELAHRASVSARHLSFLETGRSRPGRDLLLRVLDQLQVPFRVRNQLLLGAGHAPAFRERLERQLAVTGNEELAALIEEIDSYPSAPDDGDLDLGDDAGLGPLKLHAPDGGELSFVAMFATFDVPFEVTTSELAVELLFPADEGTAEALQALAA
jgi:transcriptional regulator with XRE-family HTH domain